MKLWLFYLSALAVSRGVLSQDNSTNNTFPKDFMIGVSTSAYQSEGAWNESGKGESIMDRMLHENPDINPDHSNGDVAADSYHLFKVDINILEELGVNFYRFSISWSRVLPTGLANNVNREAIDHYTDLINSLKERNIEPVVVMYHHDLPQPLQDLGGWANPVMAEYFEDYANVLYTEFGDSVKYWITINEPHSVCEGYNSSTTFLPPRVNGSGVGFYLCVYTLILSHAKAYHLYDNFRPTQKGKVGMSMGSKWYEPLTNSTNDTAAAERALQFQLGLFAQPICGSEGDYPIIVKELVNQTSAALGYCTSWLREFTTEQVSFIRGTCDFLGLNYYTSCLASNNNSTSGIDYSGAINVSLTTDPKWNQSANPDQPVVPWGLRKLLNWTKNAYKNPPMFITENGFSDNGQLSDTDRIEFIIAHMREMLKAINQDGCNVTGYTYWSLIDQYEWGKGYTLTYGLYHVNFSDPNLNRTAKNSALVFTDITRKRTLDIDKKSDARTPNGTIIIAGFTSRHNSSTNKGSFFSYSKIFLFMCLASIIFTKYIFRP